MKTTSCVLFTVAVLSVASCNPKDELLPDPKPTPITPAQTPSLKLESDTARWDSTGTIKITSDASKLRDDSGNSLDGTTLQFTHLTSPKTVTVSAINYSSNGKDSAVTKKTITIPVFSKNTTRMERYDWVYMFSNKSCIDGTENSANADWTNGPLAKDQYRFLANKTGEIKWDASQGPPLAGTIGHSKWDWVNAEETMMNTGASGTTPYIVGIIFYDDGFAATEHKGGYYLITRYKKVL